MQETIGPYRLVRVLEAHEKATVHEAVEPDTQRRLALTVFPLASLGGADAYDALRVGVMAAAQVRHPNIVAPRECGREGPSVFVAAPLVEGETLARFTARVGRLPALQGLALMAQLLSALSCAERHQWVHSALHPRHLLLARNGQLQIDAGAGVVAACAQRPRRFDSPHHLAPEVALGARPDHRADLYSAAVVAFQLLTGALPCEWNGDAAEPDAVGVRPVRSLHRELPAALDDVFARALARNPDARYACAADFWTALHAALGTPVWERQRGPSHAATGPVIRRPREGTTVRLPAVAVPVVSDESGFTSPLSRRAAMGLLVGCTAVAFWTAGLWKSELGYGSVDRVTATPIVQALDSTGHRQPAARLDGGAAPPPPPSPAPVAARTTLSTPVPPHDDPLQPSTRAPAAAPATAEPPVGPDRQRTGSPAIARSAPPRARPPADPRPGHKVRHLSKAPSPDRRCRSHDGFLREMCTVLRCATAEFREHPICVRLHREAQVRLQLAETRGAP